MGPLISPAVLFFVLAASTVKYRVFIISLPFFVVLIGPNHLFQGICEYTRLRRDITLRCK